MRLMNLFSGLLLALSFTPASAASGPRRDTLEDLSRDAYIWGYPAVLLKKTRDAMVGSENVAARMNHFIHSDQVRDSDSLYSWGWTELTEQPLVLVQAPLKDRYSAVVVIDAFSNVVRFVNGMESSSGTDVYFLTGPKWKGRLPSGAKQIISPTSEVLVLARASVRDSADATVVATQMKKHHLVAWSDWQKGVREDVSSFAAPRSPTPLQKNLAAPGLGFFEELRQIIAKNDLAEADQKELERFENLGLSAKASFASILTDPDARSMIERGLYEGEREINTRVTAGVGNKVNGWSFEMKTSALGDDFLLRAAIAKEKLFSDPPHQVIRLRVDADSESRRLNSSYRYQLRFEKEDIPLTRAGWSLSIATANTTKRNDKNEKIYSVSESTLKVNDDGSILVMIQSEPPSRGRRTNWLPLPPHSNFSVIMSAYSPGKSLVHNKYIAPSLERFDDESAPKPQRIVRRMMAFSK